MGAKLDLLMEFLAAWGENAEGACQKFVSADFECQEPPELPQGGIFEGWDAPIRISQIYTGIWDIELLGASFFDDSTTDIVISRYLLKWTSKQTGLSLTQPVVEFNTIKDGKVTRMDVFHFNPAGLLATLVQPGRKAHPAP